MSKAKSVVKKSVSRAKANVSAETFVKAVLAAAADGTGHEGVAKATGIKRSSVATRMSNLRKAGVKLPSFPRGGGGGGKKLDVSKLNALIGNG